MLTVPNGVIVGSSKTYTHSQGLSCCFRQWRAQSHCRFLHGYALQVKIEFEAQHLDQNNWVVDFGALKPFKAWLEGQFDHKTLVAMDDPEYNTFLQLADQGLIQIRPVESTGCEAFAVLIFMAVRQWLWDNNFEGRVTVTKVSVNEHETNGAWARLDV